MFKLTALLIVVNIVLVLSESNNKIAGGRIESCPGCSLNRLHEVKNFIYKDLPNYENIEFKKIQGASPELVLFDENDEEVERISLKPFSRQECNDLLVEKGFKLKEESTYNNEL